MFGQRYVLSCWECDVEYLFKSYKKARAFDKQHNGRCPTCGTPLSIAPLSRTRLTPPPELRKYKANIKTVKTWEQPEGGRLNIPTRPVPTVDSRTGVPRRMW